MSIEFIGFASAQDWSEAHRSSGPVIDPAYLGSAARAHEAGGFDRVLVAHSSASIDALQTAFFVTQETERLGVLLAQRPGFVAPTLAARQLATLDHFSKGRAALHVISGGNDTEQRRDGDYLDHDQRYARTDEFLDVVRRTWAATEPFDHHGAHYRLEGQLPSVRPLRGTLPIYFGGSSDVAIEVAAKHADVYALWGESLAQVAETIGKVRAAAARHGRADAIRFSLSLRPVLGDTEAEAWARADRIEAQVRANFPAAAARFQRPLGGQAPQNVGSQRLLQTAALGKVVDKRLWTGVAAITGAQGNSTGLVGTPDQVVESLLEYHALGITTFLIRGFDPVRDAIEYGREIIPRLRQAVAAREASAQQPQPLAA